MRGIEGGVRAIINDVGAGRVRSLVEKCSKAGRTDVFGGVGEPASPVAEYGSKLVVAYLYAGRKWTDLSSWC